MDINVKDKVTCGNGRCHRLRRSKSHDHEVKEPIGITKTYSSPLQNKDFKTFSEDGMFGPDDVAKLDIVLANVNSLLDSITGDCEKLNHRAGILEKSNYKNTTNKNDNVLLEANKMRLEHLYHFDREVTGHKSRVQTVAADKTGSRLENRETKLSDEATSMNGSHDTSTHNRSNFTSLINSHVISDQDERYPEESFARTDQYHNIPDNNRTTILTGTQFNKITFSEIELTGESSQFRSIKETESADGTESLSDQSNTTDVCLKHCRKQSDYDNVSIHSSESSTESEKDKQKNVENVTEEHNQIIRSSTILCEQDKGNFIKKKRVGKSKSSDYVEIIKINSSQKVSSFESDQKKSKSKIANLLPRRSVSLKQAFLSNRISSSHRQRSKNVETQKSRAAKFATCHSSDQSYSFGSVESLKSDTEYSKPLTKSQSTKSSSNHSPLRRKGQLRSHNLKLKIPGYRRALSLDETCGSTSNFEGGFHTAIGASTEHTFYRQPSIRKKRHKKLYRKLWDSFRHSQTDISTSPDSATSNSSKDKLSYYALKYKNEKTIMTSPAAIKLKSSSEPSLIDQNQNFLHSQTSGARQTQNKPINQIDDSFFINPYCDDSVPRRQTIDSSYVRHVKRSTSKTKISQEKTGTDLWKRLTKKHATNDRVYSSLPRPRTKKHKLSKSNRLSWQNDKVLKNPNILTARDDQNMTKETVSSKKAWKQLGRELPHNALSEKIWISKGQGIWSNMGGRSIELEETDLLRLSESECDALQDVALKQLNRIDLGVALSIPKDEFKNMNQKASFMKKYGLAASHNKSKVKAGTTHVFGIPLFRVVENDQLLRLQTQADDDDIIKSDEISPKGSTNTSRCSTPEDSVTEKTPQDSDQQLTPNTSTPPSSPRQSPKSGRALAGRHTLGKPLQRRRAIATSSLDEIDPTQSRLLEALVGSGSREKKLSLIPHTMLQVPYVVQKCCDHILKHGLHVVGIFRVAGSKKRVKQLQEEFDRGVDVQVEDDYNPHDVAALLKEFIRDLPEALLTRTLYSAFISVTKLPKSLRFPSLQCLVWLLPIPNRDTLYNILSFLYMVAENAQDSTTENGETITGNKMNVANLATIFGPNILHRNKKSKDSSSESHYQVQSADRAEESTLVINVVQDMIVNYKQLFLIPSEVHDDMLRTLKERDPDAVDFLLRRKAGSHMRERSKEFGEKLSDNENASDNTLRNSSDTDVTTTSEVIDSCQSQPENNNNSNVEESPLVTLPRNSYQRATGHLVTPETHHHFAKKTSKQNKSRNVVSLTIKTSSIDKEEEATTSPDLMTTSRGSSVIFSPSFFEGRSMSFSEEDLKEILQSNIDEPKSRKLSQVNEELEDSYLASTHVQTINEDPFDNEQYTLNNKDVDSVGTRRRGGFSVKPSADSGLGSSASLASNATDASPLLPRSSDNKTVDEPHEGHLPPKDDNNNTDHAFSSHTSTIHSINKYDLRTSTEDNDTFVKHARKKRLPSGLNLNLHGKYFSHVDTQNSQSNISSVGRSMTFTSSLSNRRVSKDDMFAPSPTTFRHHSGSTGHQRRVKEEIPAAVEIEKWKAWNKSNVKPVKLPSQTLV